MNQAAGGGDRAPLVVDQRGARCPAPVIALGRAAAVHPGRVVRLLADDPAAGPDVAAWCRLRKGTLLATEQEDSWSVYVVQLPTGT